MKHSITHGLSHEMARKVTQKALDSYRAKFSEYSPQGRWLSDDRAEVSFTVLGNTLKGAVDVLPDRVDLELKVPFMWRIFRGQAIKVIEGEINEWIAKARQGELD